MSVLIWLAIGLGVWIILGLIAAFFVGRGIRFADSKVEE